MLIINNPKVNKPIKIDKSKAKSSSNCPTVQAAPGSSPLPEKICPRKDYRGWDLPWLKDDDIVTKKGVGEWIEYGFDKEYLVYEVSIKDVKREVVSVKVLIDD